MESAEAEPSDSRPEEDGAAPCSGLPPPEQPVATVRVRGAAGRRSPYRGPPARARPTPLGPSIGLSWACYPAAGPARAGRGAGLCRRGVVGAGQQASPARRSGKGLQVGQALPLRACGRPPAWGSPGRSCAARPADLWGSSSSTALAGGRGLCAPSVLISSSRLLFLFIIGHRLNLSPPPLYIQK